MINQEDATTIGITPDTDEYTHASPTAGTQDDHGQDGSSTNIPPVVQEGGQFVLSSVKRLGPRLTVLILSIAIILLISTLLITPLLLSNPASLSAVHVAVRRIV